MGAGVSSSRRRSTPVQSVKPVDYCPVDLGWSTTPGSPKAQDIDARVGDLEDLVRKQAIQIQDMQQMLSSVQKDVQRTVSVLQYNILASYLGKNTKPWFLYGADVSAEDRKRIFLRYFEKDETGGPRHSWPSYAEGILSERDIEEVQRRDADFGWSQRRVRLLEVIRSFDADVLSLVELDQSEHFSECLGDSWDMAFQKRPRAVSLDGCGIFWRRSKFRLVAKQGFDLVDGSDDQGRAKRDRSCLMVILRWRSCDQSLVVVSTHLAKDPDNRAQTAIRVRQVSQIMSDLTDFTLQHEATEAPVILMGDLNARHFAEIRGLARTVWQIKGSPIHKFLWGASDVPTGPTSVTKARQCRIDVVQFQGSHVEVMEVQPIPRLGEGEVIPNRVHPSDHFPVCVRFKLKDTYQKHKELARAWLECVAGREKLHPLTESELRSAFDFFDRDRSSLIHRHDLEEACYDLQCNFNVDVQRLLLDCFPDQTISYTNFIRAYEARLNYERMRSVSELEYAFLFFADKSGRVRLSELEAAFREITPISFSDDEVKEMIGRLNLDENQDFVDLRSFCRVVCQATFPHCNRLRRPTKTPAAEDMDVDAKQDLTRKLNELNATLGYLDGSPAMYGGSPRSGPPQ